MATVSSFSQSGQNVDDALGVVSIEDIEAGDRIDFRTIFGRPARRVQITLTDEADEISFLINNRRSTKSVVPTRTDGVSNYSEAQEAMIRNTFRQDVYLTSPVFSYTGRFYETPEDLAIEILEIDDLTLSTGTTVTAVAW